MKKHILLILIFTATSLSMLAQDNINTKNGYAAEGYDVVAYFQNKAEKGNKKFSYTYEGVPYKFSSEDNLNTFKKDPTAYLPEYGGFCAYAIAKTGEKIGVNPKTFTITDGKLYLFYNSFGVNTLKKWNKEGAKVLQEKADANWAKGSH